MKRINKTNIAWLIATFAVYFLVEALLQLGIITPYYRITLITICINIILGIGLNLIIGFTGQFSLGHAGFMAIGAYSCAIVTLKTPTLLGFFIGIVTGIIVSSLIAFIIAIPTLRLKGDYLAIATLGASEIIRVAILNMPGLTNGAAGLSNVPIFTDWTFSYLFIVITMLIVVNFIYSSPGRACIAIREDEIAAEAMGIKTTKYKTIAFVIGAFTASIGGALYASFFNIIKPDIFSFNKSIDILIIVVFGGLGNITGTIIAAIVLGIINLFLQSFAELRMIIYGVAIVAIMVFKPGGLMGKKEFKLGALFNRKENEVKESGQ